MLALPPPIREAGIPEMLDVEDMHGDGEDPRL